MIVRSGAVQRRRADSRRILRGYSAGRRAYDARRRQGRQLDVVDREFKAIVRGDPCNFCGARGADTAHEHIEPLSDGGVNIWTNMGSACRACNTSKGARSLLEFLLWRTR